MKMFFIVILFITCMMARNPDAVGKRFGYYTVDYDKIDVNFEKLNGR